MSTEGDKRGPWYVRDFRDSTMRRLGWTGPSLDSILIVNKTPDEIIESGGESCVVARIQFDNRPEKLADSNYADARLIAAAPDLLEALKAIHAQLVAQDIKFGPLIADAEAAIAKAEEPQ